MLKRCPMLGVTSGICVALICQVIICQIICNCMRSSNLFDIIHHNVVRCGVTGEGESARWGIISEWCDNGATNCSLQVHIKPN